VLIYNAHLFGSTFEWNPGWLLTEGKSIRAVGQGGRPEHLIDDARREIDAGGGRLLPGFIDLHVHGAVGHEVMDASPEGLRQMARFYAQHGVTAFLPTTWTATREDIQAALQAVAGVMEDGSGGAKILGAHLEGPYLNSAKCGAQDTRFIRRAVEQEALAFLDTGLVRLVALAPEFPENTWLIDECVRRGIAVSAAHTEAGYEQMQAAVQRGLGQVTHTYNAMVGLGHRDLGAVGAAMGLPEIKCELIADNIHVHPVAQKILIDVKSPSGVILITDALRGTGLPDGTYDIGGRVVNFQGGEARLKDGTLAGSVLTMDRALQNALAASGRTLKEGWPMSSLNAAQAIGVADRKGSLEVGKDADLVLLDENYEVALTVVEGQVVYTRADRY
jgi:N-acetylglucosamine-6-phosphate deacetylase